MKKQLCRLRPPFHDTPGRGYTRQDVKTSPEAIRLWSRV